MFGKLKIWQKLTLIVALLGFAALFLLSLVVAERNKTISALRLEVDGVRALEPLPTFFQKVAEHRGAASAFLSGNASFRDRLTALEAEADKALDDLDAFDRRYGERLQIGAGAKELRQDWQALKAALTGLTPNESFERHTALNAKTLLLIRRIADTSGLTLDAFMDTYYMQYVFTVVGPARVEAMGQLRAYGLNILGRRAITPEERAQLSGYVSRVRAAFGDIERSYEISIGTNPSARQGLDPLFSAARATTAEYLKLANDRIIGAAAIDLDAPTYFAAATKAIDAAFSFQKALRQFLEAAADTRAKEFTRARNTVVFLVLSGFALTVALVVLVALGVTQQVRAMTELFGEIGIGNFKARAKVLSQDELGEATGSLNAMLDNTLNLIQSRGERDRIQSSIRKLLEDVSGVAEGDLTREAEVTAEVTGAIADSFNYMLTELRRIITDVQDATLQVSASANEIQATTEHLAEGSESQAAQIVDTSAAIDEMAVSIQQVSENAVLSASVADEARRNAQQGAKSVGRTIQGMAAIRDQVQETAKRIKRLGESSQEIGEIVQLIGDIADRTSILALNASIQAAMAGEAGRGFAVVAEEVERLADRSTEATKRIATLIKAIQTETNDAVAAMEGTTREVVQGTSLANEAGTALTEIQAVSNRLAELIQSISLASKQQARGSEALAKSMGDISQITQQTAAGTKQAAVSISSLASLADRLRGSLDRFRLPHRAVAR